MIDDLLKKKVQAQIQHKIATNQATNQAKIVDILYEKLDEELTRLNNMHENAMHCYRVLSDAEKQYRDFLDKH